MARKPRVPWRVRYRTSRMIFKQATSLAWRERRYWIFPALATLSILSVVAVFFAVVQTEAWQAWTEAWTGADYERPHMAAAAWIVALPTMLPIAIAMTLFNAAYVFAIHERLEGRRPTRRQAMARAWSQLGPITRFSLYGLAVAVFLNVLGIVVNRLRFLPWVGTTLQMLGNFGWAVASFFVVPILVVERDRSATSALRGSVAIARQQWGKSVAGIITISLAMMVPMLVVTSVMLLAYLAATSFLDLGWGTFMLLTFVFIGTTVVLALFATVFGQVVTATYQTALYRFAKTGKVSGPFTHATLVEAWEPYKQG